MNKPIFRTPTLRSLVNELERRVRLAHRDATLQPQRPGGLRPGPPMIIASFTARSHSALLVAAPPALENAMLPIGIVVAEKHANEMLGSGKTMMSVGLPRRLAADRREERRQEERWAERREERLRDWQEDRADRIAWPSSIAHVRPGRRGGAYDRCQHHRRRGDPDAAG